MSPTYHPETGLFYVVTLEKCDIYTSSAKEPVPSTGFRGTGGEQIADAPGTFYLRALQPNTGELAWEYEMPGHILNENCVISGDDDGHLVALDAKTGEDLWHFQMGNDLYASPITYSVDGRQYVMIATATDLFAFALFDEQ